jgi:hypothetical protein
MTSNSQLNHIRVKHHKTTYFIQYIPQQANGASTSDSIPKQIATKILNLLNPSKDPRATIRQHSAEVPEAATAVRAPVAIEDIRLYLPKQGEVKSIRDDSVVSAYSGCPKGSKLSQGLKLLSYDDKNTKTDASVSGNEIQNDMILLMSLKQEGKFFVVLKVDVLYQMDHGNQLMFHSQPF